MTGEDHLPAVFSGRTESVRVFLQAILSWIPQRAGIRVLDLGCGTGDLAIALANARPDIEIVGLDISAPNIERATDSAKTLKNDRWPTFQTADYARWTSPPFDVVVSDGVSHLVASNDSALAQKLASQVVEGGFLLVTMPNESTRNRILLLQRLLWRSLRAPLIG